MRLINWMTATPSPGKHFTEPSVTVPGQTLPLKVLLERYVRGGDVQVFPGVYDDVLPDNIEKMDVFERLELASALKSVVKTKVVKGLKPEPIPLPEPSADKEDQTSPA